jgi:hypothetical protein
MKLFFFSLFLEIQDVVCTCSCGVYVLYIIFINLCRREFFSKNCTGLSLLRDYVFFKQRVRDFSSIIEIELNTRGPAHFT